MKLSKREFIAFGGSAIAFAVMGGAPNVAFAADTAAEVEKRINDFTGGKKPAAGKVSLTTPEIAENGNTVPIGVSVESPMTKDNYVAAVLLLADGNPAPGVATFHFSHMSGEASATTRIRLAKTQNVIAVAKMNDGSVFMDKKVVKVTIGGCGG
jgi:sulfur-oxidizing protein SoxY